MLQGKTGVGDDAQVKESVEPDTWWYMACCRGRHESEMMLKLRKALNLDPDTWWVRQESKMMLKLRKVLSLILGATWHVAGQDRSRI